MATRQCCQIGKGNNLICTFHTFESDLQNLWALSAESSHHCGFWDYSTVYIALYSFHEARYCCCCSITQSCLTICNTMDCSVLGFPILLHLPGFAQTHVPWVSDAIQHLILCCPLLLLPSIFPRIRVFSMNQFFASGGQSIGVSASEPVLPMNIQDLFPLGWTD